MKIQELAIIFVIIILPISIILSEYTQFQIQTINMQTSYDAKLTAATYDAIQAFQLNAKNETYSDLANEKIENIEASVNSFRNSIMAAFELNGYTKEELNHYIPALVYTLYDGFYIYSPYKNTHDETGNRITEEKDREAMYGLKPYISYSCRYIKGNTDVIVTYALDNYITVQGTTSDPDTGAVNYVNKSGYLIDDIEISGDIIKYNGLEIKTEQLREYVPIRKANGNLEPDDESYPYVKINGTKYYLVDNYLEGDKDAIVYLSNGRPHVQHKEGDKQFIAWRYMILNNDNAKEYYKEAEKFTSWINSTELRNLKYEDAYELDGTTKIWENNQTDIFKDDNNNIENELSNFNQHRLAVIRKKIETNLAIAISNYNAFSRASETNVFQMPELKEDEWDHITHNISMISFLQGLHIGGKIYNGYSLVTNSESEEVVLEDNIYILGEEKDTNKKAYHKIGDKGLEKDGKININASNYESFTNPINPEENGRVISAGRLNLDFERSMVINNDNSKSSYYYSLKDYNASYDSIVMQNNVSTYNDIYEYVNSQKELGNERLAQAFYTALGRERNSAYKSNNNTYEYYSILIIGRANGDNNFEDKIREMLDGINEEKGFKVKYVYNNDGGIIGNYIKEEKDKYNLIVMNSFVWSAGVDSSILKEASDTTNLITISNDQTKVHIMQPEGVTMTNSKSIPGQTDNGKKMLGTIDIEGDVDSSQVAIKFRNDNEVKVNVLYKGTYVDRYDGSKTLSATNEYDLIGYWQNGDNRWVHSQVALLHGSSGEKYKQQMKLFKELVKYTLNIDQ